MRLALPLTLGMSYKSESQKVRVITEAWAEQNMYCCACGSRSVCQAPNNAEAIDFTCPECSAGYQLKARKSAICSRIVDAGYDAMLRALREDRLPHLWVLRYSADQVADMVLIPSFAIPASAIEPRRPLSPTARRAGWVGCNILLALVPPQGRIPVVTAGLAVSPAVVRDQFQASHSLKDIPPALRGWTLDVLTGLTSLHKDNFTLGEAYTLEPALSELHPQNRNIRPKVRQQLQVLRDLGFLEFHGRGRYAWRRPVHP